MFLNRCYSFWTMLSRWVTAEMEEDKLVWFGFSQEMIHFAIHLHCPLLCPILDFFFHYNLNIVKKKVYPTSGKESKRFIHIIMHPFDWVAGNRIFDVTERIKAEFCQQKGTVLLRFKMDRCFYITCSYYRSLKTQLKWADVDYYDCRYKLYLYFLCESLIKHGVVFSKWWPVYFL